ncbi:MAG: cation transporter [Bacteroidetes bacterium]|nr:cation transporter [Bacteroidota bacterium]
MESTAQQRTIFSIKHMDCAAEERMVRMKLDGMEKVRSLSFDLEQRRLTVVHTAGHEDILERLDSLNFDTTLLSTERTETVQAGSDDAAERRLLWQVLTINAAFFVIEAAAGAIAGSMGLMADSLDMLADSIVYGLSLYAVGHTVARKKRIAGISGYFQMSLALLGLVEVLRRFFGAEGMPDHRMMIAVSFFALIGNAACLILLQRSRSTGAHMQASMIFTSNDVLVNIGVIIAGLLVIATGSSMPDLIVGLIIFAIVARGAGRILQLSK